MKRFQISVALAVLILVVPLPTFASVEEAVTLPSLIFTEIKVRNDTAGLNEFIEIYNPTASDVSLGEFTIEYFNTISPSPEQLPTKVVLPEGLLASGASHVLAKDPTQITDSAPSPLNSLSDGGGILRITNNEGEMLDEFIWTSSAALAMPPIIHVPTSSSTKSVHRSIDAESKPIISPVSWSLLTPQPESTTLTPPPVIEESDPEPENEPVGEVDPEVPGTPTETQQGDEEIEPEPVQSVTLEPLQLTELLPNPKSPQTDSEDEFVELYNPNIEPIDLSGYKIQTGINFSYTYTFTDGTLAPHGYTVITSGISNLSLANTSGRARLLAPNDTVIAETGMYQDAEEGNAWALIAGSWQWTTTPTSLAANMLTLPVLEEKPVKTAKTTVAKTPKVKAASTPKVKVASTKNTKKTAAPKSPKKDDNQQAAIAAAVDVPPPLHPGVLAGVSALALLYAAYEYRTDMANRIHQFRSYREARRAARSQSSGR